jgi:hypothetical protein
MERGEIKQAEQSGMWFDEPLFHDPNGGWQWFWKCWMSPKFATWWQANNHYKSFTRENANELSKRMGEIEVVSDRCCQFCLLACCVCDTLDRI